MAISDQLTLLNNTKQAIKTSINNKGGSVTDSTPFADYSTAIDNLPSGGSGNSVLESIDVSDLTGTTFNKVASYITDATIPSGLTSITDTAFANCSRLSSINIPNSVTTIGSGAFQNCTSLTSLHFPSSVTIIPYGVCSGCRSLTTVELPSNMTAFYNQTFEYCTSLASITIPSTVTSIGTGSFYGCSGLTYIVCLPTTPPTLANSNVFFNTNNCPIYVPAASVDAYKAANNWSDYASRIYPIAQVAAVDGNPVYNYEIGNTYSTVISDNERSKIPTGDVLEFSEGLEEIGGQLGAYEEVIMPSTFKAFDDTQPINAATTTLTCKATIPPSVDGSNLGGSGLTAIYVPSAKVDAYKSAAWGWSTFASIIQAIPEDVKPAFKFTSSVDSSKDITVNCEDTATAGTLTTNDLGMSSQQIDEFRSAENTGRVEIGDCVKIYRASNCYTAKGISEVKLNEGLESIEDFAFGGMSALTEITIPSTVTNIKYQAFYADRALEGITCLATTPPTLGSDVFGNTNNCPIYVPSESVDAYKTAWSQYADRIQAIPAE